jgi:uncharacterized protein
MSEILNAELDPISTSKATQDEQPMVRSILLATAAICLLMALVGEGLSWLSFTALGWPYEMPTITADMPLDEVWRLRLRAVFSQICMFLLPSVLVLWFFRGQAPRMWAGVSLKRWPALGTIFIGALLWAVSMPLIAASFELNRLVPMPDLVREAYELAANATKSLLKMPTIWHLLANLLIVAVIPAFGEELLFRGILQQQLMRRMAPWAAIIATGMIFSFIHFQFDGFLPRTLLGMMLGWLYWRTGNIWVPIIVHFLNNGIVILAQYFVGADSSMVDLEQQTSVPWWGVLGSLAAVVGIVWAHRK